MKKVLLILGGLVVVSLVGGGLYFTQFKKAATQLENPLLIGTPTPTETQTWEDPAGFKFTYPAGVKINNHPEDTINYANLELTVDGHPGSITILVKDTKYKTIGDWQKKEATSGAQVLETELGSNPAKKMAQTNPQKLVTAAIDGNALVLIEGVFGEEKYWQEAYSNLLVSFEFIPLASEQKPTSAAPGPWQGAGGAGGVIEEEEEIIQ